jgi:copper chaperone CopZ
MSNIEISIPEETVEVSIDEDVINLTIAETPIVIDIEGGIGPEGPTGPAGPPGSTGPPGTPGGGSATVTFEQQVASDHWIVTHTWPGGFPSVTIVDTSGNTVEGDVIYTSATQIDLFFTVPFSGYVYLN